MVGKCGMVWSLLLVLTESKDSLSVWCLLTHIHVNMSGTVRPTKCCVFSDTGPLRKSFCRVFQSVDKVFSGHLGLVTLCIILSETAKTFIFIVSAEVILSNEGSV